MNDDADLRGRFAALRQENAQRMPGFTQVLRRAPTAHPRHSRVLAGAACLLLAVLPLATWQLSRDRAYQRRIGAPALADWRAPTDFLLATPASTLLHAVPQFGEPPSPPQTLPPEFDDITRADRAAPEHHS